MLPIPPGHRHAPHHLPTPDSRAPLPLRATSATPPPHPSCVPRPDPPSSRRPPLWDEATRPDLPLACHSISAREELWSDLLTSRRLPPWDGGTRPDLPSARRLPAWDEGTWPDPPRLVTHRRRKRGPSWARRAVTRRRQACCHVRRVDDPYDLFYTVMSLQASGSNEPSNKVIAL